MTMISSPANNPGHCNTTPLLLNLVKFSRYSYQQSNTMNDELKIKKKKKNKDTFNLFMITTINSPKNPGIKSSPDGAQYLSPAVCVPSLLFERTN